MSDKYRVNETSGLMALLELKLQNWARNKIKKRLKTGCVMVNGKVVTQFDHELRVGDIVEIGAPAKGISSGSQQLEILYEDRDTSGVLLFATSRQIREAVMALWGEAEKAYLAIVEGAPNPAQGTIDQPLRQDDETYHMHVGDHPDAKPAITHFQTETTAGDRTLLQVQIDTGRQHQIRAHLAWLGHPVIGDPRYGTAGIRLGLHALRLAITQPVTGKRLIFETPAPEDFLALLALLE